VGFAQVTGNGLEKLADAGLEALNQLQSLGISERGADTLLGMKNLRELRVGGLCIPKKLQEAKIVVE
jgi:hypothetical protein